MGANCANMQIEQNKIIYPELSYKINGILFDVHNELGRSCKEKQYCDRIEFWLNKLNIPYSREVTLPPSFEGERQGRNRVDFLIDSKIILEVKSKLFLDRSDYHQAKRYQNSFGCKLTLLVNFHHQYLQPKRILNSAVSE